MFVTRLCKGDRSREPKRCFREIPKANHRSALTLIEMLAALVLASIMMVGLLRIVGVVSRETIQLRREQTDHAAAGFLADRLREDLINARRILVEPNRISLAGFLTGSMTTGVVRYEVINAADRRVLVRRVNEQSEWMWVGCGNLIYQSLQEVDPETPVMEAPEPFPPIPGQFIIGLTDEDGNLLFREGIDHHAG